MKLILITAAAVSCLFLSSCAGVVQGEFRGPISGAIYDEDGVHVDQTTVANLVSKFTRLISGESVPDVILDPFSK
jgi:hypothetical protein